MSSDERAVAIERVYGQRYESFCRMAQTVTGSAESARDAVQDGFAKAFSHRERFRSEGTLEGWLWRTVLRAALDVRDRDRQVSWQGDATFDSAHVVWSPELPDPDSDPELAVALRALPARQRLVVFLRYFVDLSHDEIAAVAGIRVGTVSATLAQAKTTLARNLETTRAQPARKEEIPR
jgi:RNA polymerase sigma-70 factor (ECF subfamily)